jgi:hypothetical protein
MNQQNPFKRSHAWSRNHSLVCPLILALLAQLARSGGNDAGTGTAGRSHHELPLTHSTVLPIWSNIVDLKVLGALPQAVELW